MSNYTLKATKRTVTGKQVSQLRRKGQLPGVIYGHKVEPVSISLDAHESSLILPKVGPSTLITITVEGKDYPCLVRERQRNFIKNSYLHIDFLAVDLTEKLRTEVSIEIKGVSPAVKDFNATIVTGLSSLTVECLPQDLPEKFTIDISVLKNVGDHIYVSDIVVSDKVKILDDGSEMLAMATAHREEKETAEGEAAAAEPEVIEKGKKEEEE